MSSRIDAPTEFDHEIQEASDLLYAALDDLDSPLRNLVLSKIAESQPPARIGLVLAAGIGNPDTHHLRRQRIYLAAALELLHVAVSVHGLLLMLREDDDSEPDRSLVGGTILAGDYCFSRSAQLAAQTDNSRAVNIFAGALREISESNLRHLFDVNEAPQDDNAILFRAGILAAAELSGQYGPALDAMLAHGQRLATDLSGSTVSGDGENSAAFCALPKFQRERWRLFRAWLSAVHRNDDLPIHI